MKTIDRLHYVSQHSSEISQIAAIQLALDAGCKWIQLRAKNQGYEEILDCAHAAKELCLIYGARLIINDHPEIAAKVAAYGLHLGLEDMPIPLARTIVGPDVIIGGTANTFTHIQARVAEGAEYIGLGPFRFTTTKEKLSPILGIEGYRQILKQMRLSGLDIPVIAIGGILPEDVKGIMETGVHGVAMSGAITFAKERQRIVQSITEQQSVC